MRCLLHATDGAAFNPIPSSRNRFHRVSRILLISLALPVLFIAGCAGVTGPNNGSGGHSVALSWTPATADVKAYNVYRSESLAGPFQRLQTVQAPSNTFIDIEVTAGITYYYVVTSIASDDMESSDSVPAIAAVP